MVKRTLLSDFLNENHIGNKTKQILQKNCLKTLRRSDPTFLTKSCRFCELRDRKNSLTYALYRRFYCNEHKAQSQIMLQMRRKQRKVK